MTFCWLGHLIDQYIFQIFEISQKINLKLEYTKLSYTDDNDDNVL